MPDKTIVAIADLHVGSSVSLCVPVVNLDDGGTYHASKNQLFLWRSWENFLTQVDKRKTGEVITVINGDLPEGDFKKRTNQLVSRNTATIKSLCAEIIDPLAKMSQGVFVIRGTEAHSGPSADMEEDLARDLGAMACPETNTASWWVLPYTCEGVRLLIYHHPGSNGGGRPQNRYNGIDRLAADTVFYYANDMRQEPPDIVLCAHIHSFKDSFDHFATEAITLPCWTFKTSYVFRLGLAASLNSIGGVLIHCNGGNYEVEPLLYCAKQEPFYSIDGLKPYANDN